MALTKISRSLLDTGVSDSSDATAITITSDEKVGLGVTAPENYTFGTPLAISAPSGTNSGLTIVSATNSNGTIAMADGTSGVEAYRGFLQYSHAEDAMFIGTSGAEAVRFTSGGALSKTRTSVGTILGHNINWDGSSYQNINTSYGAKFIQMASDAVYFRRTASGSGNQNANYDMVIDSLGRISIGTTTVESGERLKIVGTGNTSLVNTILIDASDGTQQFSIRGDGLFATGVDSASPYNFSTSSSANVFIDSNGILRRSTSSLRYKKDIADATWGLEEVKQLRPVTFKSNMEGEFADDKTYAGLIAEEVHDLGLTEFVEYNDSSEPDGLHYANMVSLLTKAIQELSAKVEELESKINE